MGVGVARVLDPDAVARVGQQVARQRHRLARARQHDDLVRATGDAAGGADIVCDGVAQRRPAARVGQMQQRRAAGALRPGGCFVFTVEALDDGSDPWRLQTSGRYAHARTHVGSALHAAGFDEPACERAVLRQEAGLPVQGWLVSAALNRSVEPGQRSPSPAS